jgi:hypothetical protein
LSVIPCLTLLFVAAAYLTGPEQPPYNSRPHPPKSTHSSKHHAAEDNIFDQQE